MAFLSSAIPSSASAPNLRILVQDEGLQSSSSENELATLVTSHSNNIPASSPFLAKISKFFQNRTVKIILITGAIAVPSVAAIGGVVFFAVCYSGLFLSILKITGIGLGVIVVTGLLVGGMMLGVAQSNATYAASGYRSSQGGVGRMLGFPF